MLKIFYCATMLFMGLAKTCSQGNGTVPRTENKPKPTWLKSVYNDAVMIEGTNSKEQDGVYLIDQPVYFHVDSMPVFFITAKFPQEWLNTMNDFYPELNEFTVIVPDYEFYDKVAKDASDQGITLEPTTTNYYYYFKREDGKLTVDSYHISGEQPVLNYVIPQIPKDKIVVYRTESYGSVCCPKDERRILEEQDAPFIRQYEQQNALKIQGSYRQINGKEGEHNNYYTLKGLNTNQRLEFLIAKNKQWQFEGKTLIPLTGKHIITPEVISVETEGIRKMQPISYQKEQ